MSLSIYARSRLVRAGLVVALCLGSSAAGAAVPLGGFIPFVGIGMTDESKTLDSLDVGDIPFIADPSFAPGAPLLGAGGTPYFEIALLDTGAATHIITQSAFQGFDIPGAGLQGTNMQNVGGATGGLIVMEINDAAGIYAAGLTTAGLAASMNVGPLRGQTSIATLTAPDEWALPNILGLPMAAQHAIAIRNDQPQIFQHEGRTVRTPKVDFLDLGTGASEGITRRAPFKLRPGIGFVQGPQYVFNLSFDDILAGGEIDVANNPASPSVILDTNGNGGGLFLDIDMANGSRGFQDKEFLFDTGADLTVVSQLTAARLGFDAVLDAPDFLLEVEGSGGVAAGVPGFYVDELNIDSIGGTFTLHNVPVAVLDVPNPNDPGNIIDGILGMHVFSGRNLVIDANPSIGQGGGPPSVYIGDDVTTPHSWAAAGSSANWATTGSWASAGSPGLMWDAQAVNAGAAAKTANVTANSTVYRMTVGGPAASMTVAIQAGATLTTFGETLVEAGGRIHLQDGKIDAPFINLDGGALAGVGEVFVGTGPINGAVRNLAGRIEPGDPVGVLSITGDLANIGAGTLAIDLGGTGAGTQYDQLQVSRHAFLGGTLEVSLANLGGGVFAPSVGQLFKILTAGVGVVGEFETLLLPGGYQWEVDYDNPDNSVTLEVLGIGSIPGDFNNDSRVDGEDLVAWENGFPGMYDGSDFLTWQRHITPGGGAAAVPEPTTWALALLAAAVGKFLGNSRNLSSRGPRARAMPIYPRA